LALFKQKNKPDLRLLFATDVHGSDVCFRKFINGAKAYEAQVLILGGDVAGKRLSPLVRNGNGHFEGTLGHNTIELETDREISEFETAAGDAGLYTYKTSSEEMQAISSNPELLESVMEKLAGERLVQWLELAEQRLAGTGARLFVNCGNDDPFSLDQVIEDSAAATFLEGRVVPIDDTRFVASLGFANQTPWDCPRDVPESELASRMDATLQGWSDDQGMLIFNCHCPPYDSGLDTAQQLNTDLSIVTEGGQPVAGPVGSTAVREAIEKYRPTLSLHGHIHESKAATRIGPTLAINPGSEYPEGLLRGAIIDLDRSGVNSYVLTTG
jgi:Icc-related predicted phosphoesterase